MFTKNKLRISILFILICLATTTFTRTIYGSKEACELLYSLKPVTINGFSGTGINNCLEKLDVAVIVYMLGEYLDNNTIKTIFGNTTEELNELTNKEKIIFWIDLTRYNPALLIVSKDIQIFKDNLNNNTDLKRKLNFIWHYDEKYVPVDWSDTPPTWTSSGYESVVFAGLFTNPDYSNPEMFLYQDPQTKFTPQVMQLAKLVKYNSNKIKVIKEIYNLLEAAAPVKREASVLFFERTASEILTSGLSKGCANRAHAFVTLARAKGIPSIIVDAANLEWINGLETLDYVQGHFFAEIKLGSNWYLIDPTHGELYLDYNVHNYYFPKDFVAFYKSLSLIDAGITERTHNLLQRVAFWGKDIDDYENPDYRIKKLTNKCKILKYKRRINRLDLEADTNPVTYDTSPEFVYTITAPVEVEDLSNVE